MSNVLAPIPHIPDIVKNWVWIPDCDTTQPIQKIVVLEFIMCDNFIYRNSL